MSLPPPPPPLQPFFSNKYLVKLFERGSDTTNNRSGNPLNGNGSRFVQRKSIVKGKVRTLQPCRALVPKTLITGSKFEKVFSSRPIWQIFGRKPIIRTYLRVQFHFTFGSLKTNYFMWNLRYNFYSCKIILITTRMIRKHKSGCFKKLIDDCTRLSV